jgi:hypothetical protein
MDDIRFQLPLIWLLLLVFLTTFTLWPAVHLVRFLIRKRRKRSEPLRQSNRPASSLAAVTGILSFVFLTGLDGLLGNSQYRLSLVYGMTPEMVALLCLPIVITILTVPLLFHSFLAWNRNYRSAFGRLYFTLVTLAAVVLVSFMWNWNLIGFRY